MKNIMITAILFWLLILQLPVNGLASQGANYKYPASNKVLFYAPGYSSSHQDTSDDGFQDYLLDEGRDFFTNAAHFKATITAKEDDEATLELVSSFGAYGTVIIHTHDWFRKGTPGFRTGTMVDDESRIQHFDDLKNDRLAESKSADFWDEHQFVVFPSYIAKHVPTGSLDGTFFFLGYCASLKNNDM